MSTHLPDENTFAILKICNDSFIEDSEFLSRNLNAVIKQFKPNAWKFLTNYFYHNLTFNHSVKTKEYPFMMRSSYVSHGDLKEEYHKHFNSYRETERPGLIDWHNKMYSGKIIKECILLDLGNIVQPVRNFLSINGYMSEEDSYAGLCNELQRQRKILKLLINDIDKIPNYSVEEIKMSELILKMIIRYAYGMSSKGSASKVINMICKEIMDITFPISYNPYMIGIGEIYCKADSINTEHFNKVVTKYGLDAEIIPVRNFFYEQRKCLGEEFENEQWHFKSRGFRVI